MRDDGGTLFQAESVVLQETCARTRRRRVGFMERLPESLSMRTGGHAVLASLS